MSGTTGYDYATMTISDDVVEQAAQCLRNIGAALAEAGCTFADVVRVRYLLPDRADFEPCWPVLRRAFGEVRPAATMMVCGLADERMRIEIEVYARRGTRPGGCGSSAPTARTPCATGGTCTTRSCRPPRCPRGGPRARPAVPAGERLPRRRPRGLLDGPAAGGRGAGGDGDRPGAARLPGRGIGAALYERGLRHAREQGAGAVETVVLAANGDGLRFAAARGFAERERYVLDGESAEWVDLRLVPGGP